MALTHTFQYLKPTSLPEAVTLLEKYKGKMKILAGGTDLIVRLKEDLDKPEYVIDIKEIDEVNQLKYENGKLFIGANITFTQIVDDEDIKNKMVILWESAKLVASVGIRNRATLVGNICSAVPSLDSGPALLVYDAIVNVISKDGKRDIPINEWFTGPRKTSLKENEMVLGVTINYPEKKHSGCYLKLGRYRGEDLAQAGAGILVFEDKTYKIAFNAVGPVPIRAFKVEEFLNNRELTEENITKAQQISEEIISPITDIRATREYRIHMIKVMLKRGLLAAKERLEGKGPVPGANLLGG